MFQVVGILKPSIEYALLPFAPLCPLHSPLPPPLLPFVPLHPSPLAPTEVVGTLKPSIEYASLQFTPFDPFAPLHLLGSPSSSLCSSLAPFGPHPLPPEVAGTLKPSITYSCYPLLPCCSPTPSPFAPTEVVVTLKPNITPLLSLAPLDLLTPLTPCHPFCEHVHSKGGKRKQR